MLRSERDRGQHLGFDHLHAGEGVFHHLRILGQGAEGAVVAGRFPLVMLSHGNTGTPLALRHTSAIGAGERKQYTTSNAPSPVRHRL